LTDFLELYINYKVLVIIGAIFLLITGYISLTGLTSFFYISPQVPRTVTVPQLYSGMINSSFDKQGTGGYLVQLLDVKVVSIAGPELDRDFHVDVEDKQGNILVTEFTPFYRLQNGTRLTPPNPAINSSIDIVGIYYCDLFHSGENWHSPAVNGTGYCSEIHPVVSWAINGIGVKVPARFISGEPGPEP
jgi:hypothetical protein